MADLRWFCTILTIFYILVYFATIEVILVFSEAERNALIILSLTLQTAILGIILVALIFKKPWFLGFFGVIRVVLVIASFPFSTKIIGSFSAW